ncbi:hypothetical protein [Actinomycetospora sp. TBRC 11914]|uniref:hypothetical protein n=1 Tax=Actinomycetospora sp. TBRC 11914 TaxID=2729387 RepID=UPI00145EEE52|nr:hypothetical protein [Actinomycetospora sp. TBRC 11914]NMO90665.1 hypothetical protein [Actinomycetospora sp. TBRC 11914]
MTATAHRLSVAPTVRVRRRPTAPAGPTPGQRTNGRFVTFEGHRPAARALPRRSVPAPVQPARHRADAGWGYPPPSAYPRTPVPSWAVRAPAGLAAPAGPPADPIFVTGPTALDALLRRWLP